MCSPGAMFLFVGHGFESRRGSVSTRVLFQHGFQEQRFMLSSSCFNTGSRSSGSFSVVEDGASSYSKRTTCRSQWTAAAHTTRAEGASTRLISSAIQYDRRGWYAITSEFEYDRRPRSSSRGQSGSCPSFPESVYNSYIFAYNYSVFWASFVFVPRGHLCSFVRDRSLLFVVFPPASSSRRRIIASRTRLFALYTPDHISQ